MNKIKLICLIVSTVLLTSPGLCIAKIYEWADVSKPYNKYIRVSGTRTIEVHLSEYFINQEGKIKLLARIKDADVREEANLRVNDQPDSERFNFTTASQLAKTITFDIDKKYLFEGINYLHFSNVGTKKGDIWFYEIWELRFEIDTKEIESKVVEEGVNSNLQRDVLNYSKHSDKEYTWKDFRKPLKGDFEVRCNKWIIINVNFPEDFLRQYETIPFVLTISNQTSSSWRNDFFQINPMTYSSITYNLKKRGELISVVDNQIDIKSKYLRFGRNSFHFKSTSKSSLSGYVIKELRIDTPNIASLNTDNKPEKEQSDLSIRNAGITNSDAIAVVIGNQNYLNKDIPPVSYANNDAVKIKEYLIKVLGYRDGNIIFESNTTKAKLEMIFGTKDNHRGMLYNYIKPEKSDVFIYYSGHGAPDPQTNRAYLVPTDCNPVMMSLTGYPLDVLYSNLPKIEAKSVTVVLDACFSGGTDTGKWLVPNASPTLMKIDNPVTSQNNITIFTSAKNNQVSSWYPEKQHSMFTYFFLTAVKGAADFNKDSQITYQEIYEFVADRAEGVPYYAKRLHGGRIQNPTMHSSNKDAVFVKY